MHTVDGRMFSAACWLTCFVCGRGELSAAAAFVMAGSALIPPPLAGPEWLFLQASRHEARRTERLQGAGWSASFEETSKWVPQMLEIGRRTAASASKVGATEEQVALRDLKTDRAQTAMFQPQAMVRYVNGRPVVAVTVHCFSKSLVVLLSCGATHPPVANRRDCSQRMCLCGACLVGLSDFFRNDKTMVTQGFRHQSRNVCR